MPIDIYTRRPIETQSDEHILPRSLGGKLSAVGLIDKVTNDQFGSGIDAALDKTLQALRVILDARNADGDSPRALAGVRAPDGEQYLVAAGGKVTVRPKIKTTRIGDQLHVEGTVSDAETLKRMLLRHARRAGKNVDDMVAALMDGAKDRADAIPELTFALPLGCEDFYRATAKIACNLFAYERPGFLSSAFDPIRDYVLTGNVPPHHPVQAAFVEVTSNGLGPLDHCAKVESTPSGDVLGLVVYFGFVALTVRLGCLPAQVTPVVLRSYRVDQVNLQHRVDHPDDHRISIPSFSEVVETADDDFAARTCLQIEKLLGEALRIQRDHWLQGIIAPQFERLRALQSERATTEADQRAFSNALTNAMMKEMEPRIIAHFHRKREAEARRVSGEAFPTVSSIEGRMTDIVRIGDGEGFTVVRGHLRRQARRHHRRRNLARSPSQRGGGCRARSHLRHGTGACGIPVGSAPVPVSPRMILEPRRASHDQSSTKCPASHQSQELARWRWARS
ncbi:MAG TPA: hypothetical protein VH062_00505 [Polyangiaceae bacterium]|jgi:hypothetical protein|nr:hypothetical protein [Polyangiaceae bacterium]